MWHDGKGTGGASGSRWGSPGLCPPKCRVVIAGGELLQLFSEISAQVRVKVPSNSKSQATNFLPGISLNTKKAGSVKDGEVTPERAGLTLPA